MQEQDEDLVQIIRELQVAKGRMEIFDPRRLSEKIDVVGPSIEISTLRANIFAEILASLGVSWDEMFGQLLAFRNQYQHCLVPRSYGDGSLATWVEKNRAKKKAETLKRERELALNDVGFDWDPIETRWQRHYARLSHYHDGHRHCCPSRSYEDKELVYWVFEQRSRYASGKLSEERKKKLDELGFIFNAREAAWLEQYHQLRSFFEQYGRVNVPDTYDEGLVSWIRIQRIKYRKGNLEKLKVEMLNELRISWDPRQDAWDEKFARVQDIHESGRSRAASGTETDRWIQKQRAKYKGRKLDEEKIKKLESVGISFAPDEEFWNSMYEKLKACVGKDGCHVPYDHPDRQLFNWAVNQRALRKRGLLNLDRTKKLDRIKFVWNAVDGVWEKGFAKLVQFETREDHCNVPQRHVVDDGFKLGVWVNVQRRNKDTMPIERRQRLDAVGMVWDPRNGAWERGFAALTAFKAREGHCNVPQGHIENGFKLGMWINGQRANRSKMNAERRKRLDEIGIAWRAK
jgi:hypothetical protein